VAPVGELLGVEGAAPAAVSGRRVPPADVSAAVAAAAAAATAVHRLVAADMAGRMLRVGHHLVGHVLAAAPQKLLQADDGGQHQSDLADEEGLAGDEGDAGEGQLPEDRGLESGGGHQGSENLLRLLLLASPFLGLDGVVFGEAVDDVVEGSGGGGDGVDDVRALQVDLDGVRLEEGLDAAHDEALDGLVAVEGPRGAVRVAPGLDDLHSLGHRDGVLVSQHLVHEGEQLVLEARGGVLAEAVAVDGVEEVVFGLDRVSGAARFFLGRKGRRYRDTQQQEGDLRHDGLPERYRCVMSWRCHAGIYESYPSSATSLSTIWVRRL
jgi:hypothetical protein